MSCDIRIICSLTDGYCAVMDRAVQMEETLLISGLSKTVKGSIPLPSFRTGGRLSLDECGGRVIWGVRLCDYDSILVP